MSTPAYYPPIITAAGLQIPAYTEIMSYLLAQTTQIYGQGDYLEADSADYQWLSVFALLLSDAMQALQLVYFNRAPNSAIGAGLDSLVKLNGLIRKAATYSQCTVTITGTVGTTISNGTVRDLNGYIWDLPPSVTIPTLGSINVLALCETLGAINAPINSLTIRNTPTAGWQSVTNALPAIPGQPVEKDAQLRARQAISVALPSLTRLQGTIAAIAATVGVTRYNVQENYTNITDAWGNPAHSITCTVEGGADSDVAMVIYQNKSIGCYTNGTTSYDVTDPLTGVLSTIRYNRPTYVQFTVICQIHVFVGSPAYWQSAVQTVLVSYMNGLQIGELLTVGGLIAEAMTLNANLETPQFSVRAMQIGYATCVTNITLGTAKGSGYAANDVLSIVQAGSSSNCQFTVLTVTAGVPATITGPTQNGVGYVTASALQTVGGTGTGCTVNITAGQVTDSTDKAVGPTQVVQGIAANVTVSIV